MKQITVEQLTQLIENVEDAVNDSKFGPIVTYDDTNGPKKIIAPVAFQLYLNLLSGLIAKIDTVEIIAKPIDSDFLGVGEQN